MAMSQPRFVGVLRTSVSNGILTTAAQKRTRKRFDPLTDVQVYLAINGVLSGPVTRCPMTAKECALTFHRPIDADGPIVTIGKPVTFTLRAYAPNGAAPSVQYGFTAHAVKK